MGFKLFILLSQTLFLVIKFFQPIVYRQGENLSPILFLLFLNDLVEFMSHGFDGLPDITEAIHLLCDNDDVEVHFKPYLLLYGDDTIILVESQAFTITSCLKFNVYILPDMEIRG